MKQLSEAELESLISNGNRILTAEGAMLPERKPVRLAMRPVQVELPVPEAPLAADPSPNSSPNVIAVISDAIVRLAESQQQVVLLVKGDAQSRLAAGPPKPTSWSFQVERDEEGRMAKIIATPIQTNQQTNQRE